MDKYAKLRAFAQRDTALSHLLLFSFHFMWHWWSQVLISVIGTIIIALFIGFQKINFWFIISCVIYLVLLIGTAFCKEYDKSVLKEKSRDVYFDMHEYFHGVFCNNWSEFYQKTYDNLKLEVEKDFEFFSCFCDGKSSEKVTDYLLDN